jgi:hypothetical protein
MNQSEWDIAYNSLLSCIIGTISTLDLYHVKSTIDEYPNNILIEYYDRAVEDHCKMSIYHNDWIM